MDDVRQNTPMPRPFHPRELAQLEMANAISPGFNARICKLAQLAIHTAINNRGFKNIEDEIYAKIKQFTNRQNPGTALTVKEFYAAIGVAHQHCNFRRVTAAAETLGWVIKRKYMPDGPQCRVYTYEPTPEQRTEEQTPKVYQNSYPISQNGAVTIEHKLPPLHIPVDEEDKKTMSLKSPWEQEVITTELDPLVNDF